MRRKGRRDITIHHACLIGDKAKVLQILKRGLSVNSRNKHYHTPLQVAASNGKLHIVKALLSLGANIHARNKMGYTALHLAAKNDRVAVARFLVKSGANITAGDNNGYTPLHVACCYGRVSVTEALIKLGADVETTTDYGQTSLHIASALAFKDATKVAKLLLRYGANINAQDMNGDSSLHLACRYGNCQLTHTLVNMGADINLTNFKFRLPVTHLFELLSESSDDDDIDIDHGKIFAFFFNHVTKLRCLHYRVHRRYRTYYSEGSRHPLIVHYMNDCYEEIVRMKDEKIADTNVSFYQYINMEINELANFLRNMKVVRFLKNHETLSEFNFFYKQVQIATRNGIMRRRIVDIGSTWLRNTISEQIGLFPLSCAEHIVEYLSNKHIKLAAGITHLKEEIFVESLTAYHPDSMMRVR